MLLVYDAMERWRWLLLQQAGLPPQYCSTARTRVLLLVV